MFIKIGDNSPITVVYSSVDGLDDKSTKIALNKVIKAVKKNVENEQDKLDEEAEIK
jgi:hypothetical protein